MGLGFRILRWAGRVSPSLKDIKPCVRARLQSCRMTTTVDGFSLCTMHAAAKALTSFGLWHD